MGGGRRENNTKSEEAKQNTEKRKLTN